MRNLSDTFMDDLLAKPPPLAITAIKNNCVDALGLRTTARRHLITAVHFQTITHKEVASPVDMHHSCSRNGPMILQETVNTLIELNIVLIFPVLHTVTVDFPEMAQ